MIDQAERENIRVKGQELCDQAVEYVNKGAHTTALEYFYQAEQLFLQLEDLHWQVFLKHEKLQSLRVLERYDEALALCDEIEDGYLNNKDFKGVALLLSHKADIYIDLKNYEKALEFLRIAEAVALKESLQESLGYIYSSLSIIYSEQQDYYTACSCLIKALEYYTQENKGFDSAWCCHALGKAFENIFQISKAERLFEKSYQKYLQVNEFHISIGIMEYLRKLYIQTGQEENAQRLEEMILKTGKLCTKR